jgi:hypothetical protein
MSLSPRKEVRAGGSSLFIQSKDTVPEKGDVRKPADSHQNQLTEL